MRNKSLAQREMKEPGAQEKVVECNHCSFIGKELEFILDNYDNLVCPDCDQVVETEEGD